MTRARPRVPHCARRTLVRLEETAPGPTAPRVTPALSARPRYGRAAGAKRGLAGFRTVVNGGKQPQQDDPEGPPSRPSRLPSRTGPAQPPRRTSTGSRSARRRAASRDTISALRVAVAPARTSAQLIRELVEGSSVESTQPRQSRYPLPQAREPGATGLRRKGGGESPDQGPLLRAVTGGRRRAAIRAFGRREAPPVYFHAENIAPPVVERETRVRARFVEGRETGLAGCGGRRRGPERGL